MRCRAAIDFRPRRQAAFCDRGSRGGEHWPQPLPLSGAHAVLAAEAGDLRISLHVADLPGVHHVPPFGHEEPERESLGADRSRSFGNGVLYLLVGCHYDPASKSELTEFIGHGAVW
jgi:hypothetical protein